MEGQQSGSTNPRDESASSAAAPFDDGNKFDAGMLDGTDPYRNENEPTRGAAVMTQQMAPNAFDMHQEQLRSKEKDHLKGVLQQEHGLDHGRDQLVPHPDNFEDWQALPRPAHEAFFYRPTKLRYPKTVTKSQIIKEIYEFKESQYPVEVLKERPEKGTLTVAVFANWNTVCLKLRLWEDMDEFVLEVEYRSGCTLAFGSIFRELRAHVLPDRQKMETSEELTALDLSFFALRGVLDDDEPTQETWERMMELSHIESVCAIAHTYEAPRLNSLAKIFAEQTYGFHEILEDLERDPGATRHQMSVASLFTLSNLLIHMSSDRTNLPHLVKLCPAIVNAMHFVCGLKCPWFVVLNSLSRSYLEIIESCAKYNVPVPDSCELPAIPEDPSRYVISAQAVIEQNLQRARDALENRLVM